MAGFFVCVFVVLGFTAHVQYIKFGTLTEFLLRTDVWSFAETCCVHCC